MIKNIYYRDHLRILSPPRSATERSGLRLMPPAIPAPAPAPNVRG